MTTLARARTKAKIASLMGISFFSLTHNPSDLRHVRSWLRSLRFRESTVTLRVPLLPYCVMEFLEARLQRNAVVFEYGGGGSTLWFVQRVSRVITVEHDHSWYQRLMCELRNYHVTNCTLLYEPIDEENPVRSIGSVPGINYGSAEITGSLESYVRVIDRFPADSFDLVVVDGRSRPACLIHAIQRVKPGGLLLLDDADRTRYETGIAAMDWPHRRFRGLRHFAYAPKHVTIWERPISDCWPRGRYSA
jgi:hypothetical protein